MSTLRFNRSEAVRAASRLYDAGRYADVIASCTRGLEQPGADPELRLLRGLAYLNRDRPNEAAADWEACCGDRHLAGVAHYLLGNLLAGQFVEHHAAARAHFDRAAELGWAEGHIGRGDMLISQAFRLRDEAGQPDAARDCLQQAVAELTAGMASPVGLSKKRALSLRASAHYNLGDLEAFQRDAAESAALPGRGGMPDPRATGHDDYR